MEDDLETRFGVRFKEDVALFRNPQDHAMLIEKYNLCGSEPIDFDSLHTESVKLFEQLLKYQNITKMGVGDPIDPLSVAMYQSSRLQRKVLFGQWQDRRRAWLLTIQGTENQVKRLVREQLLDFEPVERTVHSDCIVCMDAIEEGSFAFVCENDHAFHFKCAVDFVTNALMGHCSPSTSLRCPYRCGCHFVFKGDTEPSKTLKAFERVIAAPTLKRKRPDDQPDDPNPRSLKHT